VLQLLSAAFPSLKKMQREDGAQVSQPTEHKVYILGFRVEV
jgi:hypothetical protein